MKINSIVTASIPRRLVGVSSALLLGALSLGCVAAPGGDAEAEEMVGDAADALTGYSFYSLINNLGNNSVDMGPTSAGTCVLSGVAGNLSKGFQWYSKDRESEAGVGRSGGTNLLVVREGVVDSGSVGYPLDNPVAARATCFPTTTNVQTGHWEAYPDHDIGMAPPVKIANLDPNHRRQCFLSGLTGVEGAWDQLWNWARVLEYTSTDSNHPTTGWYVEGYLHASSVDYSTPGISATCVDFPIGTTFNWYSLDSDPGETKTESITSGTGTKACGLTIINGPLNYNNYTDGVLINQPTGPGAQWTMTAKNGAGGRAVCAK